MTVDQQRGIAYMPIGGTAANYYGGGRHGNNLFVLSERALICVTCHNERTNTAGLAPNILDLSNVGEDRVLWEKVVQKLRARAMPPTGVPRPDEAAYNALMSYMEAALDSGQSRLHRLGSTVRNVLKRNGIAPAPKRSQHTTWKEFIQRHLAVFAGIDFFTAEVLTWRGLVTYYVLFFIHLESHWVSLAGITRHPDQPWTQQMAGNATGGRGASSLRGATHCMIATPSSPPCSERR